MAKTKTLNFLLELAQKDLYGTRPTTRDRYKRDLSILLSTGKNKLRYLWQYQEGMSVVVEEIKRFVDGKTEDFETLVGYLVEKKGVLHVHGDNIYADHTYEGDPGELGRMLICDQLYKLDLTRNDFAACEQCGNVYAKKSARSRFCTHLCNVNFNKAAP